MIAITCDRFRRLYHGVVTKTVTQRQEALALLTRCPTDDPKFLSVATEALTIGLGCRWAGVGRLSSDGRDIEIIALHDREGPAAPFLYPLAGSPCETVYRRADGDTYQLVESGLTSMFSVPPFLAAEGVTGYRGESILDTAGTPFAHTFALDTNPMREDETDRLFFRLASQRVGALMNQHRAEDALRASEARYYTIVDNIADGLFIHDMAGKILETNHRACAYLGYTRAEILAMKVWDIEVGTDPEDLISTWTKVAPGQTVMLEGLHRRKDGSVFPVDVRGQVFLEDDQRKVMVNARDVTAVKETERAMIAARVDAENANRAKSDFIANVSHELRTPLNAIIGFSQILSSEMLGPMGHARYGDYANDIHTSGQHLLTVISDILDLSKIEAGKETLQENEIDLDTLVDEAMNLSSGEAVARSISLEGADGIGPIRLRGDKVKLRRVLINLLSNAVKYAPTGGVVAISANVDTVARRLVLCVRDDGPGMTDEEVQRAFDAFQRLDPRVRDNASGTGLGLPIARKLCELHGGDLVLDSTPGQGTDAIVTLPLNRVLDPA